ncbi:isoprenoid synthase domain-containing protein [Podospora aff. communis PSN243]|uniref:Isoprenoid synthase domain-containing protein n=1 Tax=Podospora aff. communis PSN243 TaxID=3040156 RepID=A0AAV9GBI3_9PEZI|nr:isoprenoid synthase domain-containing protein [Podospora aff. communis PSN243]
METRFSVPVDPLEFDTQGLGEGIAVRAHKDSILEDVGIIKAQQDWRATVGPIESFKGGLHPLCSFISLAIPECLPERLEVVSYANEFAFLLDDMVEKADRETGNATITEMLEHGFLLGATEKSSGTRILQCKLALKMLSMDRDRAQTALNLWAEFLTKGGGRGDIQHAKMDEYIEYRIEDVGRALWIGSLLFGCAITIPPHETDVLVHLCRPAWIACALTNDLFSWQKEYHAALEAEHAYVSNAIWVLKAEHGVDIDGAKDLCRQMIRKNVAEYVGILKETKRNRDRYSVDLLRFLDAVAYTVSGNVAWSVGCPRYHADVQINARQREWLTEGIPQEDMDYASIKAKETVSESREPKPKRLKVQERGSL